MKKLVGERRYRWLVIGEGYVDRTRGYQVRFVLARCDCGTEKMVRWSTLICERKGSMSCGCLKAERAGQQRRRPLRERFEAALEKTPGGCWEWKKYRNERGYGVMGVGGTTRLAHRVMWELTHGPIPEGMLVCHSCDNPACCNPEHLWLGSNSQNVADMRAKGRARALKGTKNANAKLTADEVRAIRQRYAAGGISQQALADEYGLSQPAVGRVVRGVGYQDV